MISSIITFVLKAAPPLIHFFLARSAKREAMEKKIEELRKKHEAQAAENVRLKEEYKRLREMADKSRRGK